MGMSATRPTSVATSTPSSWQSTPVTTSNASPCGHPNEPTNGRRWRLSVDGVRDEQVSAGETTVLVVVDVHVSSNSGDILPVCAVIRVNRNWCASDHCSRSLFWVRALPCEFSDLMVSDEVTAVLEAIADR